MYKTTLTFFILLTVTLAPTACAQQTPAPSTRVEQTPQPPKAKPAKPEKATATTPPLGEQGPVEPVVVKLARGGKVAISSRSGRIVVSGWDRDVVQATATG